MNRDEIIRMLKEAGATRDHPEVLPDFWTLVTEDVERLLAAEREACANICDDVMDNAVTLSIKVGAGNCADKIRARGDT